jgi:hypothetical protein
MRQRGSFETRGRSRKNPSSGKLNGMGALGAVYGPPLCVCDSVFAGIASPYGAASSRGPSFARAAGRGAPHAINGGLAYADRGDDNIRRSRVE